MPCIVIRSGLSFVALLDAPLYAIRLAAAFGNLLAALSVYASAAGGARNRSRAGVSDMERWPQREIVPRLMSANLGLSPRRGIVSAGPTGVQPGCAPLP